MPVGRIPSIINDILLTSSSSRNGDSSVLAFDNIVQSFSRQNCSDMPPLLLTEEDREELLRDRENAIKCEEVLARRKQEQYFDLVDKVQNVLRRIEEKNSQKCNDYHGQKEIYNSTNATTKSPSDFNNNPSPKHLETYVKNMESFSSPNHASVASSNFGEFLNWERSKQPTGQRSNTGRYSLPANFETMYQGLPSVGNDKTSSGISAGAHHGYSNAQRPLSAYSDHHVVYGNQGDRYSDGGGRHEPGSNYHTYIHQRPLSTMSDNQLLYGGANGYDSRLGPEALRQQWNQRPLSAYTDSHQPYTNTSQNINNHHMGQPDVAQKNTKHSNTTNHSSMIDNSPISQSSESHSSFSKQREFLTLEQKRLEDHYAALQGQLMADFQQQQQELLQVYNKSMETQSGGDQTMQSILEQSFESEGTLMTSTSEEGNFTLMQTDEFPQSPFGITVKKSSNSFHNTDVEHKKPFQTNVSRNLDLKKTSIAVQNSSNGKAKKTSMSFQTSTSRGGLPQNSASPATRRLKSTFQTSAVSDQRFPRSSSSLQNSYSSQKFTSSDAKHLESSSAFQSSARKSFNSEASAQEYYDIPRFGGKNERSEMVGDIRKIGNALDVGKGSDRSMVGKTGKIASVVTSPKRTQLSSFESKAMKNMKMTQSHNFYLVSAHAKGFLTRLLFQTAKINGLITTVKDAKGVLADMNTESSQSITDRSFKERVKNQLHSAQSELRRIFVESPPHVRMQILEQNRKLVMEKETRNANKVNSAGGRPKLSNVTMKKRLSRHENQEKTPKSEKAGTPSSLKASRGAVTKERNTPKSLTKSTLTTTTTTAKTTPKNKAKNIVSPLSDAAASDTEKGTCPRVVTEVTTNTATVTSAAVTSDAVTSDAVTSAAVTSDAVTSDAVTSAAVTSATTAVTKTGKKQDTPKATRNKPAVKSSKTVAKATQASKNKRKTWDTGVLKPIQGRISPTIPTDKTRLSHEKRSSTMSTARKVAQRFVSGYQTNGVSEHSEGQSSTCEVSGIDMSKTYKVPSKAEQPVKKTGARRSLAANLSHK